VAPDALFLFFATLPLSLSSSPSSFIDHAIKSGVEVDAAGAEGLMRALCGRKACNRPLSLDAATLSVQGVGTVTVPVGVDATDAVSSFLEAARGGGHVLGPREATQIMEGVCGLASLAGPCVRPLDVRPLVLEISEVGVVEVPFGEEPADAVGKFLLDVRAAGGVVDEADAAAIMERLCGAGGKKCFAPLDVAPLSLEVAGVGTLVVPFNAEPALFVANFLTQARAAGHAMDATSAAQLMEAACARKPCLVPIDVADFSVEVEGVGTFTVPYGSEPAASLLVWVDQVVAAGGGGHITTAGAERLMEAACAEVTCFAPLDARPVEVPVEGLPAPLSVAFGADPTAATVDYLRDAVQQGWLTGEQAVELGPRLWDVACRAGRAKGPNVGYCHRPLNLKPFTLEVAEVGTLSVAFGEEPARAVLAFVERALDAKVPLDGSSVQRLMDRACAAVPCGLSVDTRATNLTVTGVGNLTVPFGMEPAVAARRFISRASYEGKPVSVDGARTIMEALCSRTRCRCAHQSTHVSITRARGTLLN